MSEENLDLPNLDALEQVPAGPIAKTVASVFFGSMVIERFGPAQISVCVDDSQVEADIVYWQGPGLAATPEIFWVWSTVGADGSHWGQGLDLDHQLKVAEVDPLAQGRRAVPGPPLDASFAGANLVLMSDVVVIESREPGIVTFQSYHLDEKPGSESVRSIRLNDRATAAR
ncbi:hypothetical protein F4553_001924 [Allocatelliglobosispora scoriae]|uniref:Uncharacterized protein n=1 Tax=Allocatelliglobosispora scoriae TaxID=643052 RepID=A0A841BLM3_9ACTN|nr:hypothetical protein [Allocatelliglobosispora scoriae]MBB5868545.1 hypothetical protein [Allocatelliglobosispora scoriae]